jgi:hypothetical protein
MLKLLIELVRREGALALVGGLCLAASVLALLAGLFDPRIVTGLNVWLKPTKFLISFAVFAWTMAWLMEYLPLEATRRKSLGRILSAVLLFEALIITTQAARGTTSHFNTSTVLDATMFYGMGAGIILLSAVMLRILVLFCVRDVDLPGPSLWGIRAGLALFLIGSIPGWFMIHLASHTVGAMDAGPGITWLNWSLTGGDLRIAHFMGLHALQVLPVCGAVISRLVKGRPSSKRIVFAALTTAYSLVMLLTFLQAVTGQPFVRIVSR